MVWYWHVAKTLMAHVILSQIQNIRDFCCEPAKILVASAVDARMVLEVQYPRDVCHHTFRWQCGDSISTCIANLRISRERCEIALNGGNMTFVRFH